jgi:hypothetical protein
VKRSAAQVTIAFCPASGRAVVLTEKISTHSSRSWAVKTPSGFLVVQAPGFPERAAEDEFDLRVQAAQVVVRPPLHRFEQLRVDPEKKRLPL